MAVITLTMPQVNKIVALLERDLESRPFFAKDRGAYVGVAGSVFYFKGCDPRYDLDWYNTTLTKFGGDDQGVYFARESFLNVKKYPNAVGIKVTVTTRTITTAIMQRTPAGR